MCSGIARGPRPQRRAEVERTGACAVLRGARHGAERAQRQCSMCGYYFSPAALSIGHAAAHGALLDAVDGCDHVRRRAAPACTVPCSCRCWSRTAPCRSTTTTRCSCSCAQGSQLRAGFVAGWALAHQPAAMLLCCVIVELARHARYCRASTVADVAVPRLARRVHCTRATRVVCPVSKCACVRGCSRRARTSCPPSPTGCCGHTRPSNVSNKCPDGADCAQ